MRKERNIQEGKMGKYNARDMGRILLLLLLSATCAIARESKPTPSPATIDPSTIPQLIESTATEGGGMSGEEQELADRIKALGSLAIPQLLPLLEHENEDVRDLTSYILRDIDGLTEEHLDELMSSRLRGNGWIPPAIARIGTPTAISFLTEELKKEKQAGTQLTYAFKLLGVKGVPHLVELFRIENVDEELLYTVISIFEKMGDNAGSAVDPLTEIALDDKCDEYARRWAILGLGSIGETAQRSVHALQELAERDPESFRPAVATALANMKAPEAVSYLLRDLDKNPDICAFRDIAELGQNGISAGPALIRYLHHNDWRVRIGAARALGFIGYAVADQSLIELLDNTEDWRLVYISAESLGRIKSTNSNSSLTRVSREHWYPPVRASAQKALEVINGKSVYELKFHPNNFPFEFFAYEYVRLDPDIYPTDGGAGSLDRDIVVSKDALNSTELTNCSYLAYSCVMNNPGHQEVPDVGIKVSDGYLVGASRGEWGGELMFIDRSGNNTLITRDNIKGIYQTPAGILAVAGLAHLTSNRGIVYKVFKNASGSWQAKNWVALPGAPRSSALCNGGSLYIACVGGQILLMPDRSIKIVNRKK